MALHAEVASGDWAARDTAFYIITHNIKLSPLFLSFFACKNDILLTYEKRFHEIAF